jgi:hypothetical protein
LSRARVERAEPSRLVLEITESVPPQTTTATIGKLADLRRIGVRLAIDDRDRLLVVGYPERSPVDILKIDKTFIDGIGEREPAGPGPGHRPARSRVRPACHRRGIERATGHGPAPARLHTRPGLSLRKPLPADGSSRCWPAGR